MSTTRARAINRVLIAIYAVLAFSALGRSIFELLVKFGEAPLPYTLSLTAASLYVVLTVAMAKSWRKMATVLLSIELAFVLAVGTLDLVSPSLFPDKTVWSGFGFGYGFFPLFMPVIGLFYLWRER